MNMQLRIYLVLALIMTLAAYPAINGRKQETEERQKFRDLEAFLYDDPVANFDRIKKMDDVCLWISRYENKTRSTEGIQIVYYLDELFRRHFQDVDEKKIEILIYLVLHCGCLDDSEFLAEKATEIFGRNPEIFVRVLGRTENWKNALDKMSYSREALQEAINNLGDTPFENELRAYSVSLQEARAQKLKDLEAFFEDPVGNFEQIKGIDDLCDLIAEYDVRPIKGHIPRDFVLDAFFNKHFVEIDEKKIAIVIHMVLHCGGGVHAELLWDEAEKIFDAHPQAFAKVLEKTSEWKRFVDKVSMLSWRYLSQGLEKLGDSPFEKELKRYVLEERKRRQR